MDYFQRGTVARIVSGPIGDPGRKHPCVFITGPFGDESNNGELSVAIVPISSTKNGRPGDPTCILKPGDHGFITRESWANYREAKILTFASVAAGIRDGRIVLSLEPMGDGALRSLFAGVRGSPDTPERVVHFHEFASIRDAD